jgi:hypothetical protein
MVLVPLASLAALALSSAEASERFRGVARLADGRIAYVEEHQVRFRGGRVASAETRYRDAEGRPLGRLASDYTRAPFAPDYEYVDLRTGAREAVRLGDEALELSAGDRRRQLPLPAGRLLVAGQGLDRFARAHLGALSRGEELRVELALPGRLSTYEFRLRVDPAIREVVRVSIEPASFLLRLLAPAITADYDPATGRLVRYRGVSNVAGPDGSALDVEIAYEYLDSASG